MARERRVTVRLNEADAESAAVHARSAGLAREGWGDGVSTLARECLRRYGARVAEELGREPVAVKPRGGRLRAPEPGEVVQVAEVPPPIAYYVCEQRHETGRRPKSPAAPCPVCGRKTVVPVVESV